MAMCSRLNLIATTAPTALIAGAALTALTAPTCCPDNAIFVRLHSMLLLPFPPMR